MDDQNYAPVGPEAVFVPDEPIAEMTPSFSAYFEAAAGNVLRDSPLSSLYRMGELTAAQNAGGGRTQSRTEARKLTAEQAKAQAEAAGVTVDFGDARYTPEAVGIMIDRARRRAVRDIVVNAYDPSWGTQIGVSLVTSLADPLNVAASFIPFVGTARYGALIGGTVSASGRAGVRAGVGAVEGLAGSALVEPLIAGAATQEGRDYTLADSLYNLAFGTAFGAGLHAGGGAVKDALFKRRVENAPVETPADIVERLPVEINEAALRGAISDLIHGRPVQSSELIDSLIGQNPTLRDTISVHATLRRDGPDLDDIPGRIAYWEERLNEIKAKPGKPVDFLAWVRSQGGVKDVDGAVAAAIGDVSHLPSSVYISPKGAKRAKRGVTLDELLAKAKAEGYAANLADLTAALQPGAKVLTQTAAKAIEARSALIAHAERLQTESGVGKNKPLVAKARAIAGREQSLLAAERARIAHAVDVLMGRKQDYEQIAEPPQDIDVPEYVPEPAPKPAQEVDADGKPKKEETGALGKPKTSEEKLATASEDPTPRDAEGKAIPGSRTYTVRQVQKAIETSIKVNDGEAVPSQRVLDDYLPGISRNKYDAAIKEIQKRKPSLVKKTDSKTKTEVVMFGKLSKAQQEQIGEKIMASKVASVRRLMAEQYPNLPNGPFFLNELFGSRVRTMFEIGEANIVKYINKQMAAGKIEASIQASTSTNPPRKIGRIGPDHLYSDDRSADVLITFKDAPPKPLAAEPADALPPAVDVELPPAPVAKIDQPPAPMDALKTEELKQFEAQFQAVEAEAVKRYQAIAAMLPADETLRLKAALEKVDAEAADLENIYNTAVQCLLNPES